MGKKKKTHWNNGWNQVILEYSLPDCLEPLERSEGGAERGAAAIRAINDNPPHAPVCLEASRTRHVDPTDERLDIVILDCIASRLQPLETAKRAKLEYCDIEPLLPCRFALRAALRVCMRAYVHASWS